MQETIDDKIAAAKKSLELLEFEKERERQEKVKKEFIERGYKPGVEIIPCGFMQNRYVIKGIDLQFNQKGDLCIKSNVIHDKIFDSWAKIVKSEEIKVGTYSVEVREGKAYINGKYYTLEELSTFSHLMTLHSDQIKFLMCGCVGEIKVSVETINSIINLIKNTK